MSDSKASGSYHAINELIEQFKNADITQPPPKSILDSLAKLEYELEKESLLGEEGDDEA